MTHPALDYLRRLFGPATLQPVFLCSLVNDKAGSDAGVRSIHSRDHQAIFTFVNRWDRPGRGLYYCMSTIAEGKPRNKNNCLETPAFVVDVDFKDLDCEGVTAENLIRALRLPPTGMIRTGHGLHVVWMLKEALATHEFLSSIETVLRQFCDVIGGDLAVAHPAALLRLPGSHNSKNGEWTEVEVVSWADRFYELDDLEEWLGEQSVVIKRKIEVRDLIEGGVSHKSPENPYLAIASELGFKPPVDVAQRLAQMTYMGVGNAGVHLTQLQVSASLIKQGVAQQEVIDLLLAASRCAAGEYGTRWNWAREQRNIEKMCEGAFEKYGVIQRDEPIRDCSHEENEMISPEQLGEEQKAFVSGNIVELKKVREEVAAKVKAVAQHGKLDVAKTVAGGTIAAIRAAGRDLMLTEGEVWLYGSGVWNIMTPAEKQWILTLIQQGFDDLKIVKRTNSLNLVWKCLVEDPALYKAKINWQRKGLIVCQNGVLDIDSWIFKPHSPDHYALRKCGADFVEDADCPKFLALLRSMFSDRTKDETDEVIVLLEEWFGAALAIGLLPRESRKACFTHGASRTGKTEISTALRLLVGNPVASLSMKEFAEDKFALQQLVGATAWIRDDAFNEGDRIDPQKFKTIITGEPIDVRRMNVVALGGVCFEIPVMLNGNNLPFARDSSDAIYNRSIVIPLNVIRTEEEASQARLDAGIRDNSTISTAIWKEEGPGILLWALCGLVELRDRGRFVVPEWIKGQVAAFKETNNPVAEWAKDHVIADPAFMVHRHDLTCSYHGWQLDTEGSEAKALGGRRFFPALRAAFPGLVDDFRSDGRWFITGVRLSKEGLLSWDMQKKQDYGLRGGSKGYSITKEEVNRRNRKAN
jgi:P4 family phage/plasmid primase-like protien